ncbi:MAG: phosphatase PAP2 family protein [Deltaproteobacteria bacterium]
MAVARQELDDGLALAWSAKPADLVLAFFGLLTPLILCYGRPPGWEAASLTFLAVAAAPLALRQVGGLLGSRLAGWGADLFPGVAFFLIYGQLGVLCDWLHPTLADARLQQIDRMIFGVQPSVWLEPHLSPGMNDLLMGCYSSYFIWPTLVGVVYLWRRDRQAFDRWAAAVTIFSMLNFVCYLLVPAMGPRFELAGAFHGPIVGDLFAGRLAEAFRHSPYLRDCFPSGHTALTLMVLWESHRRLPRLFWFILPFCTGLIIATVACRFHYGIDLICAVPLAAVALWLGDQAARAVPAMLALWSRPPPMSAERR